MDVGGPLRPTLWRTCRALANRTRLTILSFLFQQPGQTVSALSDHLKIPLPVASQYLRALEARGLLQVKRVGRRVTYRPVPNTTRGPATGLIGPLRQAFARDSNPVRSIFRAATAFTHPRRILIYSVLRRRSQTLAQLRSATRFSFRALQRHLHKLQERGFVKCRAGVWSGAVPRESLSRQLARSVIQQTRAARATGT